MQNLYEERFNLKKTEVDKQMKPLGRAPGWISRLSV